MWTRRKAPDPRSAGASGEEGPADLGTQLEDLRTHVLRCERWARFDDLLDLAVRVGRDRPGGR